MNKDIKSIGCGVKVGKQFVSGEDKKITFLGSIKSGTLLSKNEVKLFNKFDDAKETAEEVNGKVIELYAREVSEDEG